VVSTIALGADHAGYELKEALKGWLINRGVHVLDLGTHSTESVHYPDYAALVSESVADHKVERGLLVCGTGIGMAIAANKVAGIRAALVCDPATAHLAREHNNANMLALAGRLLKDEQAMQIVREFLNTPFAGGRHERRIEKIAQLDRAREQNK
jgi:ribose 5-phosphate isomerase B